MIDRIEQIIVDNWRGWFSDPLPRHLDLVKLSGNSLAEGRVILLLFAENDRAPRLTIKIPRSSTQIEATQQEYATLKQLHQSVTQELRSTLPRPLCCEPFDGLCLYMESALAGRMMGNVRSPWHVGDGQRTRRQTAENVSRALGWLSDFHLETASTRQRLNRTEIEAWTRDTVLSHQPEDVTQQQVGAALQLAIERLSELLDGQELPLSCEHGDFWPGNILLARQKLGVLDWADAKLDRLPFYDAFFFVSSYALGFAPRSGDPLWMFRSLLRSESWFSEVVWSGLSHYCQSVGLDPRASQYLLGFALARKAFGDMSPTKAETRHRQVLELWARQLLGKDG